MKTTYLYILIAFFSLNPLFAQHNEIPVDSIYILRQLSRDDQSYTPEERLAFAQRSLELAKLTEVDSTILWSNMRLASVYDNIEYYNSFIQLESQNLKKAKELEDYKAIAYCTTGIGSYYYYIGKKDSAYFYLNKSLSYLDFHDKRHLLNLNLAYLHEESNNYLKSEQYLIKALEFLNKLETSIEKLETKWSIYNTLSMISKTQERYEKALEYHSNAVEIAKEMIEKGFPDGELNISYTYNNLAEVYREQKNYPKALLYYNKALENNSYKNKDLSFYPLVLINIAFIKFLRGDNTIDKITSDLKLALHINNTLIDNYDKEVNIMGASLYLSEIYWSEQQKDSAVKYAQQTYKVSKLIEENKYVLKSLKLLADIEGGEAGKAHLKEYIKLSDSITKEERNMRNKFARIEYESDQLEADNAKLGKEKQWLFSIAAGLLGISLLVYIILMQRSKNRKLKFAKAQQQANEDIYSLMLSQQHQLEEGRLQERHRVSEELHDGVLSQLFGTRLGLSFLELEGDTEDLKKFNSYLEQMNSIEKEVRHLSHDLKINLLSTQNDFNAIINSLLDQQTELHNITYSFNHIASVNWTGVTDKIKVNLYRILQEALHNIIKHAQATMINLNVDATENKLQLTISDNGKGFNTKRVKKGIGLKNIRSRVKTLNGTLTIKSNAKQGTTIQISVPL